MVVTEHDPPKTSIPSRKPAASSLGGQRSMRTLPPIAEGAVQMAGGPSYRLRARTRFIAGRHEPCPEKGNPRGGKGAGIAE